MKMVIALAVAALGAMVLAGALSATSDLRGWPPVSSPSNTDLLSPARPGDLSFSISDCAPWTVDLHALPRSGEYEGTGTETLVACRSKSGFVQWLSIFALVVVSAGLVWKTTVGQRRRRPRGRLS